MAFLDDLKKHIEGNGFSIEMLDYCRMCFQCGGFTEEDEEEFKKILSERVREKLPDIEAYLDEALVVLCINRGVHEIVDVYFYGDVAYSKKRSDDIVRKSTYLYYMECSNYKRSYLDYLSQNLSANGISKSILERLAKSFYDIFSKYFNDSRFLETLDWEEVREMDYPYLEFALSIKESEMAKLLQQNEVFTFKLASKVQDEEKCCLLELEYSPLGEEALKVVSLIAEPLKLSSLLENKKGTKKRELTQKD